jgi:hypothetical protein
MNTDKLEKQIADLDECIIWFQSLGINPNITRIQVYKKYIKLYIKAITEGTAKELQVSDEYQEYTNAFYEITELINIYSGLKEFRVTEDLQARLSTYITGPTNISDENPAKTTNNPRDIGFELFMGSRLLKCGYSVSFKKDGDLEYKAADRNIYIECKRPSSEKKIKENVDKAFKQLEKRYSQDGTARGFIAISMSKILNKEHYTLGVPNKQALDNALPKLVGEFIQKNQLWQPRSDTRTIGVFVLLEVPCYIGQDDEFKISTFLGVVNTCPVDSEDYRFLVNMYNDLARTANV